MTEELKISEHKTGKLILIHLSIVHTPHYTYINYEVSSHRGEDWKRVTQGSQRTVILGGRGGDMGEGTCMGNDLHKVPEYPDILRK